MGASNRSLEFAKFLRRNFPCAKKVIVVADGKGDLSAELASLDFSILAIEAKPRFSLSIPKKLRDKIEYKKSWFLWDKFEKGDENLIVGMHPDEATSEIVRYGTIHQIPWAVVPCCVLGRDANDVSKFSDWIEKLKRLAGWYCSEAILPITGKNLVVYSNFRKKKQN